MLILVTGATGFIGKHLVKALAASGHAVRAALRRQDSAMLLPAGVDGIVLGDLSGPVDWGPALRGVRTIVHLAGRAHVLRQTDRAEDELYRAVNVFGTQTLAEAAARVGVERLILVSSSRAIGDESPLGERWSEETPCNPRDAYGRSKLEAERVVEAIFRRTGLDVVILRPPVVYGAGVGAYVYELFRLIHRGIPLPFRLVRNRRSFLYVGNLVDAIQRVIEAPEARGQLFHVADGEDLSTVELVRYIARAIGRPARLVPVPVAFLRTAARLGDLLQRAAHIALPINSENVSRILASLSLETTKIRSLLGWTPPWTVEDGLTATAHWFKAVVIRPS